MDSVFSSYWHAFRDTSELSASIIPFRSQKYIDRRFVLLRFSKSCLQPPLLPGFYPHYQGATLGPVHVGVRSQTAGHRLTAVRTAIVRARRKECEEASRGGGGTKAGCLAASPVGDLSTVFLLRFSIALVDTAGASSFPVNFPRTSASTSFASRCTGPRAFVRFKVGSLRCKDLLCFFKVDLLFHVIAR